MYMKPVQVVLDEQLLEMLDRAAQASRRSRSELIREALRAQLRILATADADRRVRDAYSESPQKIATGRGPEGFRQAWENEDWSVLWRGEKSAGTPSRRRTRSGRSSS